MRRWSESLRLDCCVIRKCCLTFAVIAVVTCWSQGCRALICKISTLTLTLRLEISGLHTLTPTPALKTWTLDPDFGTKIRLGLWDILWLTDCVLKDDCSNYMCGKVAWWLDTPEVARPARTACPLKPCSILGSVYYTTDRGFHQYSAGFLQLAVLQHSRWFDEAPAVSSGRRRTSRHRSQTVRAHHASQLHWLPVRRRVDFKISTLVYRLLAGTTPVYLADEDTQVTAAGRHLLRSADNRTCLVKRSCNQFGDRCFATARPTLWNSVSEQLRQPDITFG